MVPSFLRGAHQFLGPLLRPLGQPYAFFMRQRRLLYRQGRLPAYAPSRPCLSIGNIAWGGTGKTPLVSWFLGWAREEGVKAVVLSRGYKGKPGVHPFLARPDSPVERTGDEPLLLARAFPESSILVHPSRALSARYAENHLEPDLLILDDGMQHLAVRRSVDIVLLRPEDLDQEWDRVLPSGSWREGADSLATASAFVLKADPEEFSSLEALARNRLAAFGKPVFSFSLRPLGLIPLSATGDSVAAGRKSSGWNAFSPQSLEPEEYRATPYILVSGVGNSAGVERTASRLMGRSPVQHFAFADHHPYTVQDVQAVLKMSAAPLPVLCTAKDAVKLLPLASAFGAVPVWVLETVPEFGPALFCEGGFQDWWQALWRVLARDENRAQATLMSGSGGAS